MSLTTLKQMFPGPTDTWLAVIVAVMFFAFPTMLALGNVAMLLLLVTGGMMLWRSDVRHVLRNSLVAWILISLYALLCLGVLYTPADWEWVSLHLSKYIKVLVAALLIGLMTGKPGLQRLAMSAFMAAMGVTLASTWLNVWLVLPWSASQQTGWGKSHHVFGDYITQNVMMSFFCTLALHKAVQATSMPGKLLWGVVAGAAVLSVTHLSQGRTGYLLLLASLVTYALVMARGRWLALSLTGVAVAAAMTLGASHMLQNRFTQALQEAQASDVNNESSIGHRLYNYKITPKLVAEAPLIGHGTGAYHVEICRVMERPEQCPIFNWHPHNQFLFFAADHGLLGVALYLALIIGMVTMALRSQDPTGRPMLLVLAAILMVDSMINSPLWSARESHFFMAMLGLLVAMCHNSSDLIKTRNVRDGVQNTAADGV